MKSIYTSNRIKYSMLVMCFMFIFITQQAHSQSDTNSSILDKITIGLRGGINKPDMTYSDPYLSSYQTLSFYRGALGVYAEIDLSKHISIRPELMIIGKGQIIDNTEFYYEFLSTYVDWRLPFILNFTKPNTVRPYLMFAPVIGFATGGTIYMDDGYDYYGTDITDKSISPVDISMLLGAGIKVPIKLGDFKIVAGIEGTLDIGLIDTYSSYEHDGSSYGLNMDYYPIEGSRNNVGLELTASIAIPLSNFKKKQVEKEPKKVIMPEKKVEESEIIKSCYTIEEINTLIDAKKNVNNKVICMNNLNFEFNKSSLDKDSKTYLNNVLVLLEKVSSMKMKISGHTDNVGTDEYNMELSKKRSSAVYDYLISNGISKDRLSFEYFGSTKPLVENNSDENRAKNRRVEFEILEK